jgi:hypothetical protein
MRLVIGMLVAGIGSTALVGCKQPAPPPKHGPPPLKLSFRKSQIPTEGMVVGINNPSSSETVQVIAVFVQGKNEKDERSYRLDRELKPLDSISVGWVQLKGWKLKPGDKLRVRCEGYTEDFEGEVPDS